MNATPNATRDPGRKLRIAHLAGPNATITNTPPLVTSNKARAAHDLPLLRDAAGQPQRFDPLRPQRLAAPVTVYVEQFSAHPLEADASELYGPPDGYLDAAGRFSAEPRGPGDRPVYRIELSPEDGLYPMPYMARQRDGSAWEHDGTGPRVSREQSRQPFMPDGERLFEETDRFGIDVHGHGNVIGRLAEIAFFRTGPSGGYSRGRDGGAPEIAGRDFFPYRPPHLNASPGRAALARITNQVRRILEGSDFDGAIWTQGSPRIEETVYWFNLCLDIRIPLCGNASQRYHGQISHDGPKNLADSVEWIASRVWADADGSNRAGVVMVQDQRVFAARDVAKLDARPGGYAASGGHGGILGAAGGGTGSVLRYVPATLHTYRSELLVSRLPHSVAGLARDAAGALQPVTVAVRDAAGDLVEAAMPKVAIVKDASYVEDDETGDPTQEVDVAAFLAHMPSVSPLSGFVLEGLSPYGKAAATSKTRALLHAACSGFPVVNVGRGNTEGFAIAGGPFIAGSNLTATKARMLLMLCLLKFGMWPAASNPAAPTPDEMAAIVAARDAYQRIFDTH